LVVLGLLRRCGWASVVVVTHRMLLIWALLRTRDYVHHFAWIQWLPVVSGMFGSLSLDDLKLFFRRCKRNACDMVCSGYPRVTDYNPLMFLV
jgi:hypothetical protein